MGVPSVSEPAPPATPPARVRRRKRWVRLLVVAFVALGLGLAAWRLPRAVRDTVAALDELRHPAVGWLVVLVASEVVSMLCFADAQRRLLTAAGERLRLGVTVAIAVAGNAVSVTLPAGGVPAGGWMAAAYAHRGARPTSAAWTVLAGGFCSAVTLLALLLTGLGVAGLASVLVLAVVGAALAAGSVGFLVLVHHLGRLTARVADRAHGVSARVASRLREPMAQLAAVRPGVGNGTAALALSAGNWLFDAVCLVAAFRTLHLGVPWRTLWVAYAAGQLAGAARLLPGGLALVEGGMIGVLVGTGQPFGPAAAAVTLYRLVSFWALLVAGAGSWVLLRRWSGADGQPA